VFASTILISEEPVKVAEPMLTIVSAAEAVKPEPVIVTTSPPNISPLSGVSEAMNGKPKGYKKRRKGCNIKQGWRRLK
jgi:hypothetical protein